MKGFSGAWDGRHGTGRQAAGGALQFWIEAREDAGTTQVMLAK